MLKSTLTVEKCKIVIDIINTQQCILFHTTCIVFKKFLNFYLQYWHYNNFNTLRKFCGE